MPKMIDSGPPSVKLSETGLDNWDEIRRWAVHNDPVWNRAECEARLLGLNESDRLKLLSALLLHSKTQTFRVLLDVEKRKLIL